MDILNLPGLVPVGQPEIDDDYLQTSADTEAINGLAKVENRNYDFEYQRARILFGRLTPPPGDSIE